VTESTPAPPRRPLVLGAAYIANFGALAASSPFMALHLGAVGFSPSMAAELLAILLLVPLVATPVWTLLADHLGTIGGVLGVVSLGALLAFAALLLDPRPALVASLLLVFVMFRAPFGALLDSLALRDARNGGSFGAVRAWGTAGYALAAVVTGALIERDGTRAVLYVTTTLLAAALVAALWVRGVGSPAPRRRDAGTWALVASLLRRPRVLTLFAVALLQEVGLAPYDALFPAYLTKLAGANAAGVAVAVGAGSEFLFLLGATPIVRRLGPERLLVLACAGSTVRWASIALVTNPSALIAIQGLHALAFGAFYVASVTLMDQESPPSLRASGQGIFGSFSFGVAASIGLSIAGLVERHGGMRAIFSTAAGASLLATLGASLLRAQPRAEPVARPG
jgi:PPP family 3-phenylpropionic acid transporter